ncbi:MAG: hypothetical protein NTU48_00640 [Legionellales bacterium]|nr:hypothetical protein [Legionellales bacterium]
MSKILLSLVMLFHNISAYALSTEQFPNTFSIKQIKCSEGKHCVAMTTDHNNGQTMGTLRSDHTQPHIFYFFDEQQQKQITIKKLTINAGGEECTPDYCLIFHHFDVFDKNNHLIAKLELSDSGAGLSFDGLRLYTKDRKHLLLNGMHTRLSGTRSVIYDGLDHNHKLVLITRPLFTFSLDSEVTIWDKPGLLFAVDPNMFAATLALYCNTSLYYNEPLTTDVDQPISNKVRLDLRAKLQDLAESTGMLGDIHANVSDQALKAAKEHLSQRYQQTYAEDFWDPNGLFTKDRKLQQMVQLGSDLIMAHGMSPAEDQATLQFLISLLYLE